MAVLIRANEGDGEALGAEAAGTTDSMKVGVGIHRHVEVKHDVDLLDVDTTAKQLGCYEDTVSKLLETLVDLKSKVQNAVKPPTLIQIQNPYGKQVPFTYLSSRAILECMALEGIAFLLRTSLSFTA